LLSQQILGSSRSVLSVGQLALSVVERLGPIF
jgi:hypothetical protein